MKPLSPTDSLFLLMENSTSPMHVAGLQFYTLPDDAGPDFIQNLVEKAREYTQAKGRFNLYPVSKLGRQYWAEDQDFDVDYHFRHISLPKPGRIRELLALVSRLHATPLDRTRPLWEFSVIEGLADGRVAVYMKVHHALFDGVSAMKAAQRSQTTDPQNRDMPPIWAQDPPKRKKSSQSLTSPVQDLINSMTSGLGMVPGFAKGLNDLMGRKTTANKALPYRAPATIFNKRISSSRRFAAESYKIERLTAIGKHFGCTLNDVVLAICGGALREYLISHNALPDEPLIAMVPVSIRTEETGDEGNQVSVILASLGTHIADPTTRLKHIVQSTKAAKDDLRKLSHSERIAYAAGLLSPMMFTQLANYNKRPAFNIVISNVPGPKEPLYLNGARLDSTYPVSIVVNGQALNITLNSYLDNMQVGFIACRRAVPQMQRLLDHTEKSIADLEHAAAGKD